MSASDGAILAAATALADAARTGHPTGPIGSLIGNDDVDAAYLVQQQLTQWRLADGARIVGRKIGLTSEAVQQQIGVDRPDFGVLFDDMQFGDGELIPSERLLQPRAEAEIAFVLGVDITDASDIDVVRASVATAHAALEIVDSRVSDWKILIADTVADNASSGVFVLSPNAFTLDEFAPADVTMRMTRNGELVSTGEGRACLGDPLNALAWLAATAIEVGDPLRAGDIVLSGALGPMISVSPGDEFIADISPLGSVTARFSQ